jgi:hypothetical protein
MWNLIDMINPTLVLMMLINFYIDEDQLTVTGPETIMGACSTFTMWAKQLYFLRVFDSYSYLIRMITMVIVDMREFLVVLMLAILAFSDTYNNISEGNQTDSQFVNGPFDSFLMSYKMALGDFDTDNFGEVAVPMCLVLFYLSTVFNMIVMFNLLIAIISETFANVNSNALLAAYQEKSNMVAENSYLVPHWVKKSACEDNSFLVIAQYKEDEKNSSSDPIGTKVENLHKFMGEAILKINKRQTNYETMLQAMLDHHGVVIEEDVY